MHAARRSRLHAHISNTVGTCSAARRARCCHFFCAAVGADASAADALVSSAPPTSGGWNGVNLHGSMACRSSSCDRRGALGSLGVSGVEAVPLGDPIAAGRGLRACGLDPAAGEALPGREEDHHMARVHTNAPQAATAATGRSIAHMDRILTVARASPGLGSPPVGSQENATGLWRVGNANGSEA